jgi:phytoene synthase
MGAVYHALLDRMLAEGWAPPRRRARISKPYLLYLIVRCSVFG